MDAKKVVVCVYYYINPVGYTRGALESFTDNQILNICKIHGTIWPIKQLIKLGNFDFESEGYYARLLIKT
jgi:hypothetical protein